MLLSYITSILSFITSNTWIFSYITSILSHNASNTWILSYITSILSYIPIPSTLSYFTSTRPGRWCSRLAGLLYDIALFRHRLTAQERC